MNKHYLRAIFFILLSQHVSAQSSAEIMMEQKEIVGRLSGERPYDGSKKLYARGSAEEREIARSILSDRIRDIGFAPQYHAYKMPNLNPLIDLLFSPFKGVNVFAELPATTSSDEFIILGAHYDSEIECPGAIDNATGSALILSIMHQIATLEKRSKNLMIVFFDQEEEDLIGSQAFAKYLKRQGTQVHSVHTFDMVGWDGDGDGEIELELPAPYLKKVYKDKANEMGIPIYTTSINSTDHHSFRQLGFPAIGINEAYGKRDSSPYKDTPQDTFETVNFEYLANSTRYVIEVVKELMK